MQKFRHGDQGELDVVGTFLLVVEEVLIMGKGPGCATGPMVAQVVLATRVNSELHQVLEGQPGEFKVILAGPRLKA